MRARKTWIPEKRFVRNDWGEKTETAFCNGGMCYLGHKEHMKQTFLKPSEHHSGKLICHSGLYTGGLGSKATLAFQRTYVQTDKMAFRMNIR